MYILLLDCNQTLHHIVFLEDKLTWFLAKPLLWHTYYMEQIKQRMSQTAFHSEWQYLALLVTIPASDNKVQSANIQKYQIRWSPCFSNHVILNMITKKFWLLKTCIIKILLDSKVILDLNWTLLLQTSMATFWNYDTTMHIMAHQTNLLSSSTWNT